MSTIQNINSDFGDSIKFSASTVDLAVADMLASVKACGEEFDDVDMLVEGVDYEIIAA